MMPIYWVSYSIIGGSGNALDVFDDGKLLSLASCTVTLANAPQDEVEVTRLADVITEEQRSRGRIPQDAHVGVLSWSPMGSDIGGEPR